MNFEEKLDGPGGSCFLGLGMARKTRIEFAGAVYHLLDRGDRREAIYRDRTDRERFLATLALGHPSSVSRCVARARQIKTRRSLSPAG